jgi:O-antigen/teichoic acid export membrane protein
MRFPYRLPFGGLARGTLLTTSGLVTRAGLQAAYLVVVSRWLGAESYGLFAGSVTAAILLMPLAGWGMGYVFTELASHGSGPATGLWPRIVSQALLSGVLVAVVVVALTGTAMSVRVDLADMALLAVAELVALPLAQIAAMALVAMNRSDFGALATCAVPAARLSGAIGLVAAGLSPSVHLLAMTHCLGSVVATVLVMALANRVVNGRANAVASAKALPGRLALLREGASYAAGAMASLTYVEVDKVLVLQLLGAGAAGTYTAAFRVTSVLVIPITALVGNALPRLFAAERAGQGSPLLRRIATAAIGYSVIGGLLALVAAPLMPLVFGAEYRGSSQFVTLLAAWIPLAALHLTGATALVAAGGKTARLVVEAAGLTLIVLLNLLLLPRLGVQGAIVALLIGELLMALACWLSLGHYRRMRAVKPHP